MRFKIIIFFFVSIGSMQTLFSMENIQDPPSLRDPAMRARDMPIKALLSAPEFFLSFLHQYKFLEEIQAMKKQVFENFQSSDQNKRQEATVLCRTIKFKVVALPKIERNYFFEYIRERDDQLFTWLTNLLDQDFALEVNDVPYFRPITLLQPISPIEEKKFSPEHFEEMQRKAFKLLQNSQNNQRHYGTC